MDAQPTGRERWRRVEALLVVTLVFLKVNVLYHTWGRAEGYDWSDWLSVMRWTHWFEPLPSTRFPLGFSYHPPLSYLLGRLIYSVYPHEIEASQILSTGAILVAFFALRSTLRRIGWLYGLPGLWVLYGGMSIPLLVWLAIETLYDGLVLTWFMLALATSVALFWSPPSTHKWWRNLTFCSRLTGLGIVFACGLMTKFNAMLAIALPFLIIFFRRGVRALLRESSAPMVAAAIGVAIIAPFYHHHFYEPEGSWMPISMEWDRPQDLAMARAKRDRDPATFLGNMLQIPTELPDSQQPVMKSFISMEWLQTWKRDICLGGQPKLSLAFSNGYSRFFAWTFLLGTLVFFTRRQHIPRSWRHFGWVLLSTTVIYSMAALTFGWKYPLWDWRIFKAKYMGPAVFWIPYATGVLFSDTWFQRTYWTRLRCIEDAAFLLLVSFMFINHLLPVY